MLIRELKGLKTIPKLKTDSVIVKDKNYTVNSEINNYLKSLGFKHLKSGGYGVTYLSKMAVLKVFSDDDGYEHWIKFIKSVPGEFKKYVPIVSNVRSLPNNPSIKFVKIEKLEELSDDYYEQFEATYSLLHLIDYIRITNYQDIDDKYQLKEKIQQLGKDFYYYYNYLDIADIDFLKFLVYTESARNKFGKNSDLGPSNVMLRNNNQFVVTDPWV